MLALRPLLAGPPRNLGLVPGRRDPPPPRSAQHAGAEGLGSLSQRWLHPSKGSPGLLASSNTQGFFFFLRRRLLTPSLSSFSRGTARGVGKKQNRCERWSLALAECRGAAGLVQHRGGVGDGMHTAGLGPLLAGSCGDLCWVLGTMLHPGQPGWGSHGRPGCGARLWTPPLRGDIARPCP